MSYRQTPPLSLLRKAALPAVAVVVMAFFGTNAVIGINGALAFGDYQHRRASGETRLAALKQRQRVLANRVSLLDPRRANPDMVDELARKQLNVVNPDELVVPLK
ncbi:septum formation initiator family protein [uncultured Sphingomonas sp.]|uniref:FtsB family cell division protein n=1 Tax=uncultured Sphingomonas sp. TaxID=158754 RepID=UPI0035CC8FC7